MTFCLSVQAVIAIHDRVCDVQGLRDPGSLEGTLARPMHTGLGQELYPTIVQKAAALLHGLARTQPFIDGNKRTAWVACVTFLAQHQLRVAERVTQDEVYEFVMRVSVGECGTEDIALTLLGWLAD